MGGAGGVYSTAMKNTVTLRTLAVLLLLGEPAAAQTAYKDGTFTGKPVDTEWGNVQVKAVIQGSVLVDVQFLQYPFHRTRSAELSGYTMPRLRTEAIKAQSANVYLYTGATMTAEGFQESLTSALGQAER